MGGVSGADGTFLRAVAHNREFAQALLHIANGMRTGTGILTRALTSARLIPLTKTSGGVRPIAVGDIFYRTCAKALVRKLRGGLHPKQFGVGTKLGVEPLIHFLRTRPPTDTIISIDLKNAFNSISRAAMYTAVLKHLPVHLPHRVLGLSHPCHSIPSRWQHSHLVVRGPSRRPPGPPPLQPPLPRNHHQPHSKIQGDLSGGPLAVCSYLDDTYITVPASEAPAALDKITQVFQSARTHGLHLRPEKTQIWTNTRPNAKALGNLVGTGAQQHLQDILQGWATQVEQLRHLATQDAFILLRQVLLPRLNFLQRTSAVPLDTWALADHALRRLINHTLRRPLNTPLPSVTQTLVGLPIRMGGLGLPPPSTVSSAAFEASLVASAEFLSARLGVHEQDLAILQPTDLPDTQAQPPTQRARLQQAHTDSPQCRAPSTTRGTAYRIRAPHRGWESIPNRTPTHP